MGLFEISIRLLAILKFGQEIFVYGLRFVTFVQSLTCILISLFGMMHVCISTEMQHSLFWTHHLYHLFSLQAQEVTVERNNNAITESNDNTATNPCPKPVVSTRKEHIYSGLGKFQRDALLIEATKAWDIEVTFDCAEKDLKDRMDERLFSNRKSLRFGNQKLFNMGSFPHFTDCEVVSDLGLALKHQNDTMRYEYLKGSLVCNCASPYVPRPQFDRGSFHKQELMNYLSGMRTPRSGPRNRRF